MVVAIVQIRDVPDPVMERLKLRAEAVGLSLSEYLRGELARLAGQPTMAEIVERVAALPPVEGVSGAAEVRAARAERGRRP